MITTRLAPSPTGYLHLGNIWAFLIAWLAARQSGGKVFLRIDDIDPNRSKANYIDALFRDLEWLGLDWDGQPYFQSKHCDLYAETAKNLSRYLYPCFCTRAELRQLANAPHIDDYGVPYPGTCHKLREEERRKLLEQGRQHSLRFHIPACTIEFQDVIQGPQSFTLEQMGGDFPVCRSDGVWAYQLATVVDDKEMGVNMVIRGRDIIPSTPRQILLSQVIGAAIPSYAHLPLILDETSQRLAKRHQALSISSLRSCGYSPEYLIALLGYTGGFYPSLEPVSAVQLLSTFTMSTIPAEDRTFPVRDLFSNCFLT